MGHTQFCDLLRMHMRSQSCTQEQLASMARVSRETINRVCTGTNRPSIQIIGAIVYILCLSPHDARALFLSAGYWLDAPDPSVAKARAIIDAPHSVDDPEKLRAALDMLAACGFANRDHDGI